MKVRIKFNKTGAMKFVGHLDTMRYFQRAIRRAGIDISYTAGFSPHPIMSFALPLGVGVESEGEYFDIQVNSSLSSEQSIKLLNEQMADGVQILSYKKLPDETKKAMSLVEAADYILLLREGYTIPDNFSEILDNFYSQQKIMIIKQTKKSEREIDIKPLIFKMNFSENGIFMRLKAGSVDNIKPDLVLEALYKFIGQSMPKFAFLIKRQELYTIDQDNRLLPLSLTGEEVL